MLMSWGLADIADILFEFVHSMDPDKIQDLDEEMKAN